MTSVVTGTRSTVSVWVWRVLFVGAVLLQLYGVYAPREAGPQVGIPQIDKVAHCFLFAAVAFTGLKVGVPARWLLGALAANAIVSELAQYWWLPQRDGDPYDSLADLAGVALGAWLGFRATVAGRARRRTT
ncbi:VanZ family protein [Kribbella sp. NPDC026611]|uniref:VanZ family protein n=1 Tax=Kribbella sp. NPDC026611 TaxID=3154911 RepID=UPI0033E5DB86